jgi:hypothetical protein
VSSATKWNIEHHGNALAKFLAGLRDEQNLFEAAALIEYLQTSGNELREPRSKSLGNGLFELRGKQVRIFYVFRPGNRIVLLDGMLKKRTDIPVRMVRRLRRLRGEVQSIAKRYAAPRSKGIFRRRGSSWTGSGRKFDDAAVKRRLPLW